MISCVMMIFSTGIGRGGRKKQHHHHHGSNGSCSEEQDCIRSIPRDCVCASIDAVHFGRAR